MIAYAMAMLIFFIARGREIPFNEAAFFSMMYLLASKLADISCRLESIQKKLR